jgi:hypothetical protein
VGRVGQLMRNTLKFAVDFICRSSLSRRSVAGFGCPDVVSRDDVAR